MNEQNENGMVTPPKPGEVPQEETSLPDGIGLTLDDVQALLAKKHETIVPKDDPMLMIVTLLNAYLGEVDTLHARHGKALAALMAGKTDAYVKGVQGATDALAAQLSASSVEGIRKVFVEHAGQLQSLKSGMWYAAAIVAVSALVNVAVFVLRGVR